MKIFIDIGAHAGETIEAVLATDLFDRIYGFEPVSLCLQELEKIKDQRVNILPFGLANSDRRAPVYNAGTLGASIYTESSWKTVTPLDLCPYGTTEDCEFRRASDWFRENLFSLKEDLVIAKLNCEGAEIEILDDLLNTGEINKIDFLNVAWDDNLFPGAHKQIEMEERLRAAKVKFIRSTDPYDPPFDFSPFLPHADYTTYWLKLAMLCTQHAGPKAGWRP